MRRPISVLTMVIAVAFLGFLAVDRMSRDIFPDLGVPVLYVAQPYGGMDPAQMEGFITYYYEYHFLYITGIEHVESEVDPGRSADEARNSIPAPTWPGDGGDGRLREPRARLHAAGDRAAVHHAVRRGQRAGGPARVLQRDANSAEMQDLALFNRVRPLFATLPGVSAPPPFGGNQRTIVVTLDPDKLRPYSMSPDEVMRGVEQRNTVSPRATSASATSRRCAGQLRRRRISSELWNNIPIRSRGTQTIFMRDVGSVEDGTDILTAYALVDGTPHGLHPRNQARGRLDTRASSRRVKANLPRFQTRTCQRCRRSATSSTSRVT